MLASELLSAIAIFAENDLVEAPATMASYYATDPGAFLVAVAVVDEPKKETNAEEKDTKPENEEKEEKVIACIAAPLTTHGTRHLGLYACRAAYRGLDIGKHLFTYCLEEVVREDNCGLASVPSKLKVYKHYCGFSLEEKVALIFYEGVPARLDLLKTISQLGEDNKFSLVRLDAGRRKNNLNASSSSSSCSNGNDKDEGDTSHQVLPSTTEAENVEREVIEQIIAYDADVHFESRRDLMTLEINQADTSTVAVLDEDTQKVVGFGLVRPDFGKLKRDKK